MAERPPFGAFRDLVEHVRSRPGMYIGGRRPAGLWRWLRGLIADLTRSAPGEVHVDLREDGSLSLRLSTAPPELPDLEGPETGVESLYYDFAVAAAFSEWCALEAEHGQRAWKHRFVDGRTETPLAGTVSASPGLRLTMKPEQDFLRMNPLDSFHVLCSWIRDLALFRPNTRFSVQDVRLGLVRQYRYPQGLPSYLSEIDYFSWYADKDQVTYHLVGCDGADRAEVVIRDGGSEVPIVHSFVNEFPCAGGTHLTGLARGFWEVVAQVDPDDWRLKDRDDPLHGLTVLVSLTLEDPQWASATKSGPIVGDSPERLVYRLVKEQLPRQLHSRK